MELNEVRFLCFCKYSGVEKKVIGIKHFIWENI